jgi:hypothetical protein
MAPNGNTQEHIQYRSVQDIKVRVPHATTTMCTGIIQQVVTDELNMFGCSHHTARVKAQHRTHLGHDWSTRNFGLHATTITCLCCNKACS